MLTFLKRILWDESAFERWGRALLVGATLYAQTQGWVPDDLVPILIGGGLLIPAGEKNPKK